jgi:hypothetical protein
VEPRLLPEVAPKAQAHALWVIRTILQATQSTGCETPL